MKRRLPPWLQNNLKSSINSNCESGPENDSQLPETHKRITRSSSGPVKEADEPKVKQYQLPFIDYQGKIEYCSSVIDIACACDTLLDFIQKSIARTEPTSNVNVENECSLNLNHESTSNLNQESTECTPKIPIAFDMEWPFSFKTGPGRTATIQLCADESICYVFSIGNLKKLPLALKQLLTHQRILLHGVNIKNDFRKLERDFPEMKSDLLVENCLDLSTMCNEVLNTSGRWSLERLVNYVCKLQINKDNKVRMSRWNNVPLDPNQLMYAAIDVYIGQVIYRKLEKKEQDKTPDSIQQQILLKKLNLD